MLGHCYWLDRGLDAVKVLTLNFKNRKWYLPDLICDEVLGIAKETVSNIEFYHVNDNFTWDMHIKPEDHAPKVVYTIDYFGRESRIGREAPPNTIVIRDSV